MGADFDFEYVAIEMGRDNEEIKRSMLQAVDEFVIPELNGNLKEKVLNDLSDEPSEELEEFSDLWENILGKDLNENNFPVENYTEEVLSEDEIKNILRKIVNDFFECVECYNDIGEIEHKGEIIYISGGMSYGDSPTDSMKVLEKFNYLPTKIKEAGGIK
jgi:hypothetical protein